MTNVDVLILSKLGFCLSYKHRKRIQYLKERASKGDVSSTHYEFLKPSTDRTKMVHQAKGI